MKRIKILYIITQGGIWGGAQRYIYDLAINLANDYDITIAVGEPRGRKDLQSRITNHIPHIKIIQLKHLVRRISPTHDILAIFELRKLYKKIKPDIIHLNSSKAGILGSLAKWYVLRGTCYVVYTVHGWVFNEPLSKLKKWLYKKLESFTARFKNYFIVLSQADKQSALGIKIPEKKLHIIPPGIDTNKKYLTKNETRNQLSQLTNKPINQSTVIGTIANLYPTKGLDVLIEAVRILNTQYSILNTQYFIIGDGPERKNLELLITNYQLPNIHLLGHLKNASQYLPAFDIFVLPSHKEGFPYTLLEAMAQNIPVIATDVGGIPTLIHHKKTGSLIKPDNANELAKTISETYLNQEQSKIFARQALSEVQKYTLKNTLDRTSSLYHQLLLLK